MIVGDSEIDEEEVSVSFRGNPITGEEVHCFPGWYENVPRDERMTESEYARLLQQHCQMLNGSTPVSENTQPNRDNPHGIEQP